EIRVRNVFDELERNTSDQIRGDREMSSCAMLAVVRDAEREQARADADREFLVQRDLRELLGLPSPRPDTNTPAVPGDYCLWLEQLRARIPARLLPLKAAAEAAAPPAPVTAAGVQSPAPETPAPQSPVAQAPAPPAPPSAPQQPGPGARKARPEAPVATKPAVGGKPSLRPPLTPPTTAPPADSVKRPPPATPPR